MFLHACISILNHKVQVYYKSNFHYNYFQSSNLSHREQMFEILKQESDIENTNIHTKGNFETPFLKPWLDLNIALQSFTFNCTVDAKKTTLHFINFCNNSLKCLNPIRDHQKSALKRSSKWPPNDPKFCDFSYFYIYDLSEK